MGIEHWEWQHWILATFGQVTGKLAARASHGNVNEDNLGNVANVEMLPVSMLPIANGN